MKKENFGGWMIAVVGLLFTISLIANIAHSSESHHSIVYVDVPTNYQANNYQIGSKGVASAISAAQCHFDGGSFDLQLCGGYGNAFGQDAYTFGAGQKVGDFLLNFTETTENGKSSYGLGINWKVKFK